MKSFEAGKFKNNFGFPRKVPKFPWTDKRIRAEGNNLNSLRRRCSTFPVRDINVKSEFRLREACLLEFYLKTSVLVGMERIFFAAVRLHPKPINSNVIPWLWRKWKSKEKCCWPYPCTTLIIQQQKIFVTVLNTAVHLKSVINFSIAFTGISRQIRDGKNHGGVDSHLTSRT